MNYQASISYNISYTDNTDIVNGPSTISMCDVNIESTDEIYPDTGGFISISSPISWTETITVTGAHCNLGNPNGGSSQTFTFQSDPDCQYGNAFGVCVDNLSRAVQVYFNPPIGCMDENSCNYNSGAVYDDGSCDGGPTGSGFNQYYCLGTSLRSCETDCPCNTVFGSCGGGDCNSDQKQKKRDCVNNTADSECDLYDQVCDCTYMNSCNDAISLTLEESNDSDSVITGQMLSFIGEASDPDIYDTYEPQYWRMFISDTADASGNVYSEDDVTLTDDVDGGDWNTESPGDFTIEKDIYFTENLKSDGTPLMAGEYYVIFDVADDRGDFNPLGDDARTNYGFITVLGDNPGCKPDLVSGGSENDSPSGDEQAINYNYRPEGGDVTYHSRKHCLSLDALHAFVDSLSNFLSNGYYDGNDIEIPIGEAYQPITGDRVKIRIDLDDDWVYDEFEDWGLNDAAVVSIDYNYVDGNNLSHTTEDMYLERDDEPNDIYDNNEYHLKDSVGQVYNLAGDYTIRVYFIVPPANILYHRDFSFTIEETLPEDLQIVDQSNELYEDFSIYFDVDDMPFTYTFNGSYVDPTTPIGDLEFNWTITTPTDETQTSTLQNFGDFTFDEIGTYTILFSVTDPLGTVSTSITVNVYDEFFNKLGNFLTGTYVSPQTSEIDVEINESFTDLDAWLISNVEFGNYLGDTLTTYCTDVESDNVGFLEAELAKIVLGDDGYTQYQYDIVDDDNLDPDYAIFPYDATKSYVVPDADNAGAITTYLGQEVSTNELPNPATGNETYIIFEYQTGVDADGDTNPDPYQYVDLYVENVNYFEAKLSDLGNPATPQIYNLGSLDIPPNMDVNPDYHVFQYDSNFADYTTLAAIYSQGKLDGDAESGTTNDISYLETQLSTIAGSSPHTYTKCNGTVDGFGVECNTLSDNDCGNTNADNGDCSLSDNPDYHIFNWLSGYEYTTNDIEVAEWLGTVEFGSKQTYNINNVDVDFAVFSYDADLDAGGNYAGLTSLDAIYDAGRTDAFQDEDNVEYLATELYNITSQFTEVGLSQNFDLDVNNDEEIDDFQYAIFPLDDNLPISVYAQFNIDDGINTLNDLYEAGITAGQTDTFQDLDNVAFLEAELAKIVAGDGYDANEYDVGNTGTPDYHIFDYDSNYDGLTTLYAIYEAGVDATLLDVFDGTTYTYNEITYDIFAQQEGFEYEQIDAYPSIYVDVTNAPAVKVLTYPTEAEFFDNCSFYDVLNDSIYNLEGSPSEFSNSDVIILYYDKYIGSEFENHNVILRKTASGWQVQIYLINGEVSNDFDAKTSIEIGMGVWIQKLQQPSIIKWTLPDSCGPEQEPEEGDEE